MNVLDLTAVQFFSVAWRHWRAWILTDFRSCFNIPPKLKTAVDLLSPKFWQDIDLKRWPPNDLEDAVLVKCLHYQVIGHKRCLIETERTECVRRTLSMLTVEADVLQDVNLRSRAIVNFW
jgi:hypothetical protein